MTNQVVLASLSDQIFNYIAANKDFETLPITIHKQFTTLGYSKLAINEALTTMVKNGSLGIDLDTGFITIGSRDN